MPESKIPHNDEREQKRLYMLEWRARNRERLREYQKQYEATHPEKKKAQGERYYAKHSQDPEWIARKNELARKNAAKPEQKLKKAEAHKRCRAADPEKLRAAGRDVANRLYHAKSVDERRAIRSARAEYVKQWRAEHQEELRVYAQKYFEEHRADFSEQSRAHYAKNKIAYIQRANKRRALLSGTYTTEDIQRLYETQLGFCPGCRKPLDGKYEIDHIMPLALDPTGDRLENLQLLCRLCNRRKRSLHPDAWAARIGKLFI